MMVNSRMDCIGTMASTTTLSANNLERLGTARLAELLMAVSQGDAAAKRYLRLALVEAASPDDLAPMVRKRLREIARSRAWIEGEKRKTLRHDLETLRCTITEKIAERAPNDALDLLWQFLALAPSVCERCDDSSGRTGEIFAGARADMYSIAEAAKPDPLVLAEQICAGLSDNGYGQYDGLIGVLAESLGASGLEHLKSLFEARMADPSLSGWERSTSRYALHDIADATGDADAYAAQYDGKTRAVPAIAAKIAERFLGAGRPDDAMAALNAVKIEEGSRLIDDWERVRINALEALGRSDNAQAARWAVFERRLDPVHLRAFLKRLPDFDDEEAEDRAMSYAKSFDNVHAALHFLLLWPALDHAAELIEARWGELDGNYYELLSPASDALETDHPLAATLACRALIDHTLNKVKYKRYRHAARHLATCERLAAALPADNTIEDHETYVGTLRARHGRKSSFWGLID